jgi:FkbM family methyltransferase
MPTTRIVMTRETDIFHSVTEKANIANRENGDLFICIHVNAAPPKKFITGYKNETYYTGKGSKRKKHNRKKPIYGSNPNPMYGSSTYVWAADRSDNKAAGLANDDRFETEAEVVDVPDPQSPEALIRARLWTQKFFSNSVRLATMFENEFTNIGRRSLGVLQRNWKGICIDPNPELVDLYKKIRPKDHFINAGIGASSESLDYFMFKESSMNTFSEDFYEKYKEHSPLLKKIKIPLVSLKEVLDKNLKENDRLDFFDIDVEGLDLEVLKTNDWEKYRPKIIIIESDIPLKEDLDSAIVHYLALQNYRLIGKSIIHTDLGNLFFISN